MYDVHLSTFFVYVTETDEFVTRFSFTQTLWTGGRYVGISTQERRKKSACRRSAVGHALQGRACNDLAGEYKYTRPGLHIIPVGMYKVFSDSLYSRPGLFPA